MIDSQSCVTPEHRIIQQPGKTWFTCMQEDSREWLEAVRTLLIPEHKGHLDLVVLMMQLGKQWVNSIWVEAGPMLAGALLQAGLADEPIICIASKLLGNDTCGLCILPGFEKLADASQFKFREVRYVGPDAYLHLVGVQSPSSKGEQCTEYYAKIRPPTGLYSSPKEEDEHY